MDTNPMQKLWNQAGLLRAKKTVFKLYDEGLRELFYQNSNYQEPLMLVLQSLKPNTVYRFRDEFLSKFIVFIHPEMQPETIVIIGPYRTDDMSIAELYTHTSSLSIHPTACPMFKTIYQSIPWLAHEASLLTMVTSYAEVLWNGLDNFTVEHLDRNNISLLKTAPIKADHKSPALLSHMKESESFYQTENQLLEAISRGNVHVAELLLERLKQTSRKSSLHSTLEEQKNYAHILNALFRKTAEKAGVPPYYANELAESFSEKIGLLSSVSKMQDLQHELISEYCHLINKLSVAHYAPVTRNIMTYINMDLTNDLSLAALADAFHMDRRYLSSFFHEDTGITLTEYVQRQRMEHAVFLMENTLLPISSIAQLCGILDPNYFSRLFRKYHTASPSEYRKRIQNRHLKESQP